jgi:hypothetical protein
VHHLYEIVSMMAVSESNESVTTVGRDSSSVVNGISLFFLFDIPLTNQLLRQSVLQLLKSANFALSTLALWGLEGFF